MAANRVVAVKGRRLRKVGKARFLVKDNAALVWSQNARDAVKQSGFSGAVLSDERGLLTFVQAKRHVGKKRLFAADFCEILYRKQVHLSSLSPSAKALE